MSSSNISESKLRKFVVIIVTFFNHVFLVQIEPIYSSLLFFRFIFHVPYFLLVCTFFFVVFLDICVCTVGPNMSRISTFMAGCTFIPIFIVLINCSFCYIIIKCDFILWWVYCPWLPVLVLFFKILSPIYL